MDMSTTMSPGENSTTFTQVFGHQCEIMQAAVQSLDTLNDQITYFITNKPVMADRPSDDSLPEEQDTLKKSLNLMRHLLLDVQERMSQGMVHWGNHADATTTDE
ncbi:uncharacterized protein LOC144509969 [Mustelus asterias]